MIKTKSIYDKKDAADGLRVLVMRFWPRGVRKDKIDFWEKRLAPSKELIRSLKSGKLIWSEFEKRYRKEMEQQKASITELASKAADRNVTLLCWEKENENCHRQILRKLVHKEMMRNERLQKALI